MKVQLCGLPASGIELFQANCQQAEFPLASSELHAPRRIPGTFVVTVVKHPLTWLVDLYHQHLRRPITCESIQPWLQALTECKTDLRRFICRYLDGELGSIAAQFEAYPADSVCRWEDLPWCASELFETFGFEYSGNLVHPVRFSPRADLADLSRKVLQREHEFYERYDYYG